MVEINTRTIYFCRLCKQEYESFNEASECESKKVSLKYLPNQKVKLFKSPGYGLGISLLDGASVPFCKEDSEDDFLITNVLVKKQTHNLVYIIKKILTENDKKHALEFKQRIKDTWFKSNSRLNKLDEKAIMMNDEEFIEDYARKFLVPEDCLSPLEK